MSASAINSKVTDAVTAIESGDWDTALTKLLAAKALLAALPDSRKGTAELEWDRAAIDSLIRDVKQQQGVAVGGLQTTLREYATESGDDC